MRTFFRALIIISALIVTAILTLYGCVIADEGAKQVGGYFEENTAFSAWREEDGSAHLILFNYTLF